MSLFEIELNKDFKILNSSVFLNEQDFKKYYKSNKLNDGYDDNIQELVNPYKFNIHQDKFVIYGYHYDYKEIENVIVSNVYELNCDCNEINLYPEWLLFLIAIKKNKIQFISEHEFDKYLPYFKYIAEIRYKKFIIRNVRNYIKYNEYSSVNNYRKTLHDNFLKYLNSTRHKIEDLYSFLDFLYKFYQELKENEKYKLMWNLEIYIEETIILLRDQDIPFDEIYQNVFKYMRGTYSVLHEVYLYKPLYIKESKHYFRSYVQKINTLFNEQITTDDLIKQLMQDEKMQDTLLYYLELTKRFNANKRNELVMSALIKATVLGIEEVIRYKFNCTERDKLNLYDKCIKKICSGSHQLKPYYDLINPVMNNEDFFMKFDELCKMTDSLEKFLMVFYHSRNYLAHNNIDMNNFFWGDDGQRTVISNVIDSLLIILYKLSKVENEATYETTN